ncbi:hypothetical protein [Bacillus sp. FJAT-26390]|uniref:hypothetical protein n=1 Tax=Bacillus sp. FJAT-26390 TaxID=1743142 RepID=UPI000807F15F|nr:hypothetical protein [Bacillus sp. FJAT-26390]OBZ16907.1 hypothetical protein A7975_03115 [Bacillus sp. FJAT-26390]
MLKNRLFLIGLGAGIIIGALLFQLMLSGEQSRQKLGQMGTEPSGKLYTQVEVDALLEAERDSFKLDQEAKAGTKTQAEPKTEPAKEEQPAATMDAPSPTAEPVKEEAAIKHVIRIEAGSNLTKTAELLAANHIIDNKTAFISQMKKSKKLVRAGYFLFQEKMTVAEAIVVVTGEPITKKEADAITSSKKAG